MSLKREIIPYLNVPLSDALFTIDSRDGLRVEPTGVLPVPGSDAGFIIDTQNPYDLNIQKRQQLFSGQVSRVALTEINMPWCIPNVNGYNNVIYIEWKNSLVPGVVNLTPVEMDFNEEFVTAAELAPILQSRLNSVAVGGLTGWTVEYLSTECKFSISVGSSLTITFRVNPMFGLPKGMGEVNNQMVPRSSTLAEMMGFAYASREFDVAQVSSFATMQYTSYVDVVSSVLCKNMPVRDTSTNYFTGQNILARIYISPDMNYSINDTGSNVIGTRPFWLHYNFPVPKQISWSPEEFLPSVNIRLQDQYGNILYTPFTTPTLGESGNSAFVQLTMQISEASNV